MTERQKDRKTTEQKDNRTERQQNRKTTELKDNKSERQQIRKTTGQKDNGSERQQDRKTMGQKDRVFGAPLFHSLCHLITETVQWWLECNIVTSTHLARDALKIK